MQTFAKQRPDLGSHIQIPVRLASGKEKFIQIVNPLPSQQPPELDNEEYNVILQHPKHGEILAMSIDLEFHTEQT